VAGRDRSSFFASSGLVRTKETHHIAPILERFCAAVACTGLCSCKIGIRQAVFKISSLQVLVNEVLVVSGNK